MWIHVTPAAGGILIVLVGVMDASCPSWFVFLQTCPPSRRWQRLAAVTGTSKFLWLFMTDVYDWEFISSYVTFCIMRVCRYWTGYIYLCCELQRRTEAFTAICQLDDISLLEDADGKTFRQNYNLLWAERRVHNRDVCQGLPRRILKTTCRLYGNPVYIHMTH